MEVDPCARCAGVSENGGRDRLNVVAGDSGYSTIQSRSRRPPALRMKLALFADIHSNLEALTACLEHAKPQGAERYAFLGDLVGYGADPVAVLEVIERFAAQGAAVVLGNHNAVTVTRRIIGLTTLDFGTQLLQTVPPPNELGAAGMISVLPCLVLVALFHRRIITGLTEGLVKG